MAVTASTRLGLTRWSDDADPQNRGQFDADNQRLDDLVAIDLQGLLAARPAASAANRGAYHWATDAGLAATRRLTRSDGAAWVNVGPAAPRPVADRILGAGHAGGLVARAYAAPGPVQTILYTVPADRLAVVRRLEVISNLNAVSDFSVAVNPAGGNGMAGNVNLAFGAQIGMGEDHEFLVDTPLAAGTTVVVYGSSVAIHFLIAVQEFPLANIGETGGLLGRGNPGSAWTTIYTVPAARQAAITRLHISHIGAGDVAAVEWHVRLLTAAAAVQTVRGSEFTGAHHYTDDVLVGVPLAAGEQVQVYGGGVEAAFHLFGTEVAV